MSISMLGHYITVTMNNPDGLGDPSESCSREDSELSATQIVDIPWYNSYYICTSIGLFSLLLQRVENSTEPQ